MTVPFIDAQLDQNWYLQGRVIPPSCSSGNGCVLHLQTRSVDWSEKHFHVGRIPLNAEAAVEFLVSLLMPAENNLVRESFDSKEQEQELEYLAMAKLSQPDDTIAFPTVTGLTIIIHADGLGKLFSQSDKCRDCKAQEESAAILRPDLPELANFDSLMEIVGNEKNH